mgnify:CR=1 FL=1
MRGGEPDHASAVMAGMSEPLDRPPRFAHLRSGGSLALFLDFDGTLVDIAPRPDAVILPPGFGTRLEQIANGLGGRLAIVSGRSLSDIDQLAGPLAIPMAGSHGAEVRHSWTVAGSPAEAGFVGELALAATRATDGWPGLLIERKSHGVALHFRAAPQLEADAVQIAGELAQSRDLELRTGKCVVEIVPPGTGKGEAVDLFMKRPPFAGAKPLFIGDDTTDEDGFRAVLAHGGFGVIVGERTATAARYRLPSPDDVWAWLHDDD